MKNPVTGADTAEGPEQGSDPAETDRELASAQRMLTVGVGASRGVAGDEVLGLVRRVLDEGGLPAACVRELATVDAKAGEPGLLAAADRLGVPLRTYPSGALCAVDVPTPSELTRTAVATPSVAEAAALLASGEGGRLLVRKTSSAGPGRAAMATAAVATAAMPSAVGAPLAVPAGGATGTWAGGDGRGRGRPGGKEAE
ncbi:cobalamin biosynthesis protein [Streptomyces ovatisporus]|uniref:Cobalamin biosynthesis protein n=1 Tax=Streptomyces ovatisporus TaxID=1128682 RepID=A0ABV9ABM1_9ACTN